MSENILSLEDLKFLEDLYFKNGIESLRFDDEGLKLNNENSFPTKEGSSFDECYLCELAKKMKYRLNSNFQFNFSSGFNFDVVKI